MKRIVIYLIITISIAGICLAQGTMRVMSDGTEWMYNFEEEWRPVTVITADWPESPGGLNPSPWEKVLDDGAVWIGLDETASDSGETGFIYFQRKLPMLPAKHSRATIWYSADDSLEAVGLFDRYGSAQWFFPNPGDGTDWDEMRRLDMTDAIIVPEQPYTLGIWIANSSHTRTGLFYYFSVDWGQETRYCYRWQAGWALHSLPFRPENPATTNLLTIFPDALAAGYQDYFTGNWYWLDLTTPFTGEFGDTVRSNSIFVYHSGTSAGSYPYGIPISEQRYLDMRPDDNPTRYHYLGTVDCTVPFDCDLGEPDDLPDYGVDELQRFSQIIDDFVLDDEIAPFVSPNYGAGYVIHYSDTVPDADNAHLDLRCSEKLGREEYMSSIPVFEGPPEMPSAVLEYMEYLAERPIPVPVEGETLDIAYPEPVVRNVDGDSPPLPPSILPKLNMPKPDSREIVTIATPNPFNSSVKITAVIPNGSEDVKISIFDISGRLIRDLAPVSGELDSEYNAVWDGKDESGTTVPTGIYYYKISAGNQNAIDRVFFIK